MKIGPYGISTEETWDAVWHTQDEPATYADRRARSLKVLEKIGLFVQMGISFAPDERVLEAGCGDALLISELRRLFGVQAYGIDFSSEAIKCASEAEEEQGVALNLSVADVCQSGYGECFFDKIISLGVIEHLPSPEVALAEKYRTLRPGGLLILMTPNKHSFGRFDRRLQQFLGQWPFGFQDEFTTLELKSMCESVGFEILREQVEPRKAASTNTPFLRQISRVDRLFRAFSENWGFYSYVVARRPRH